MHCQGNIFSMFPRKSVNTYWSQEYFEKIILGTVTVSGSWTNDSMHVVMKVTYMQMVNHGLQQYYQNFQIKVVYILLNLSIYQNKPSQ